MTEECNIEYRPMTVLHNVGSLSVCKEEKKECLRDISSQTIGKWDSFGFCLESCGGEKELLLPQRFISFIYWFCSLYNSLKTYILSVLFR